MACGLLYPNPRVCCASITIEGACAQALDAQKANAKTGKQSNFRFETGNFDGITDMATALLYNFSSVIPGPGG
jgi:hypothetical protein